MKTIKISNAEITLKEYATRGLKKEINRVMDVKMTLENAEKKGDKPSVKHDSIPTSKFDEANDVAVLGMIQKIIIDGKEVVKSQAFIDEMREDDYEKLLSAVQEIMGLG